MLNYPVFSTSKKIQAAAKNAPPLKKGNKGYAVVILQSSLLDLGYKLPLSTKGGGIPDGIYGGETKLVVEKFQKDNKLKDDGISGKNTIEKLDSLMVVKKSKTPKALPPKPVFPTSRNYKVGTNDPIVTPDVGAGLWNSEDILYSTFAQKVFISKALPVATVVIGSDAVKHMEHYFKGSGFELSINLIKMVNDVDSAKKFYELEVKQAMKYVEKLPQGTHNITSTRTQGGYNKKHESKNWYFAVGGYSVWGKGKAIISKSTSGREYKLEFEYKFFDRYNWDKGKKVDINIPIINEEFEITDEFMADFHRQGLAREYNLVGSFKKTFNWKHGELISSVEMKPEPGSR